MKISKYHGTGNDFVMIEDLGDRLTLTPGLVAALCDRHMGVGADGVIRIAPASGADFFMDYRNADGALAEMCGNGIRCLGKYVYERGLTERTRLDVETRAGRKRLDFRVADGTVEAVTVDMGVPAFERASIPMAGEGTFVDQPFEVEGMSFRATALSMGNPHLVLIGESDPASVEVPRIGPTLEHHPDFPELTNVEFVRVADGAVLVRVWERGSGETMACGTGACASLVAANLAGAVARRAGVVFPGGELEVEWTDEDRLLLTGPATFVFDADVDEGWLAAATGGARAAIAAERRGAAG